jgi:putative salt-induced outer membrane protein YdiY
MRTFRFAVSAALFAAAFSDPSGAHAAENDGKSSLTTTWGLNLTRGNSDTILGSASARWELHRGRNALSTEADFSYGETEIETDDGKTETQTLADSVELALDYKRENDRSYRYANGSGLRDEVSEIDYRITVGVGAGFYPVQTDNTSTSIDLGAGYLWEKLAEDSDAYPVFRLSERYEQQVSPHSKIWQALEYIPKAGDFERFILNAETGAEAAMNSFLSLRIKLENSYNSHPAEDRDKNDLSLTASVVWRK